MKVNVLKQEKLQNMDEKARLHERLKQEKEISAKRISEGQILGSSIHTVVGRDCLWTYGTSGAPPPGPDSEQSNLESEKCFRKLALP